MIELSEAQKKRDDERRAQQESLKTTRSKFDQYGAEADREGGEKGTASLAAEQAAARARIADLKAENAQKDAERQRKYYESFSGTEGGKGLVESLAKVRAAIEKKSTGLLGEDFTGWSLEQLKTRKEELTTRGKAIDPALGVKNLENMGRINELIDLLPKEESLVKAESAVGAKMKADEKAAEIAKIEAASAHEEANKLAQHSKEVNTQFAKLTLEIEKAEEAFGQFSDKLKARGRLEDAQILQKYVEKSPAIQEMGSLALQPGDHKEAVRMIERHLIQQHENLTEIIRLFTNGTDQDREIAARLKAINANQRGLPQ